MQPMSLTLFPAGRARRRLLALGALVAAAFALLVLPRIAAAANPAAVVSNSEAASAVHAKKVKTYWTPRRMRHATPLTAMPSRRDVAKAAAAAPAIDARGKVQTVPPTRGRADNPLTKVPMANLISNPSVYPYRTQGKVFFKSGGGSYVCSATVVNTPTKRVVFTAGHCVVDEDVWSTNFAFVPGYKNGSKPYGTFVAANDSLYSLQGWATAGNYSYDMAAAVLGGTRKVAEIVGSRGIKFNLARQQNFVSFGYPAGLPFNGQQLYSCPSPYKGQDPTTTNPRTQWINCNMTGGSSGGGWIVQGQYLNSVNSYGYNTQPGRMYGPYFGTGAQNLYNGVKSLAP